MLNWLNSYGTVYKTYIRVGLQRFSYSLRFQYSIPKPGTLSTSISYLSVSHTAHCFNLSLVITYSVFPIQTVLVYCSWKHSSSHLNVQQCAKYYHHWLSHGKQCKNWEHWKSVVISCDYQKLLSYTLLRVLVGCDMAYCDQQDAMSTDPAIKIQLYPCDMWHVTDCL